MAGVHVVGGVLCRKPRAWHRDLNARREPALLRFVISRSVEQLAQIAAVRPEDLVGMKSPDVSTVVRPQIVTTPQPKHRPFQVHSQSTNIKGTATTSSPIAG